MSYLRQPIICVLGHVDHGKTSLLDYIRNSKIINNEAGGITQHIGATEVPRNYLESIVKNIISKDKLKVPGLLFIDTPGHKAFTTLRKRGGAICDIGILIIDINEGFMPQTIEAIEILKSQKTPFIIACNKIDKVYNFNYDKNKNAIQNLESQKDEVKYKIEELIYTIVGKLSEFEIDSDRFDRIDDFTKKIAIVPISAHTGFGTLELISTLVGLTQKYMEKKLLIENEKSSKGIVLEVKNYTGLGKTFDMILYDGKIKNNDIIFSNSNGEIIKSYVKSILKPNDLNEIRDSKTKFISLKEQKSSSGIKICSPDFNIVSGSQIITLRENATNEEIKKVEEELLNVKIENTIKLSENGILIKADTLGSLEALSLILEEHSIPIRKAKVGIVTKNDILDAKIDLENNEINALILNFSQDISDEILILAKENKIEVFSEKIIYKLIEKATLFIEKKQKEIEMKKVSNLTLPFSFKILENCIFRASSPAIIGVQTTKGKTISNISLMNSNGKKIGKIKSIKDRDKTLNELKLNESAAVSIDDLTIGRGADVNDEIYTFMGEENFRDLKKNKNLLSEDEIDCLKKIATIMRKENKLWGI